MNKKVLVINAGSTSCKFMIFEFPSEKILAQGNARNIGLEDCAILIEYGDQKNETFTPSFNYQQALNKIFSLVVDLKVIKSLEELEFVGHRFVHGGELKESKLMTNDIVETIEKMSPFVPLHNPPSLQCYKLIKENYPHFKHVAVFDTSFHATIPNFEFLFPVPLRFYTNHKIRRYGFHGTSFRSILQMFIDETGIKKPNLIVAHIGGGGSVCAIKDGKSYATTMGLTPLGGFSMLTRSGDLDPSVLEHIIKTENLTLDQAMEVLWKKSGVQGLAELPTGKSFIDLTKEAREGNEKYAIALRNYTEGIIGYIAKYYFKLRGKVDAIIFTGGVCEHSVYVREQFFSAIQETLQLKYKKDYNPNHSIKSWHELTDENNKLKMIVLPTKEELIIARDTYEITN
ncbi:hypothetical protein ASO20_02035 [Mycoplasma sp. (ex Biomphalaria glabrata)]|uniref:acetate/propionate family kinase n=1 Tax=Mycoplasma sp. (ex Biomphalaria glabrata) TaxID=1749074 RepID=UPI00073AA550|nr:acetate/propionate family kinase [Mycoplasma sp. (ex Biomphalaria glabrata)]ALV23423.1 hypothetical protein ASO20_02035 [Mycoplasma sp. (ex Biomphalaria glabrata)]